jgi:hypothetical protein
MTEEKRCLNLPVKNNRQVVYTLPFTAHGLLRAWIGLSMGMGLEV